MSRIALLLALSAPLLAAAAEPRAPTPGPAVLEALMLDPAVGEISGLAASRRDPGLLWAINDSDNGNLLHALGRDGRVRASLPVEGAENVDWEDLAAFRWRGRDWLLIADTGDNGGLRHELTLLMIEEPRLAADRPTRVRPAWTVRMRYPDGPRDCEAVAVDPVRGEALLVAKKRVPVQLFAVSIAEPAANELRTAQQIAATAHIPQPSAEELARDPIAGRYRGQVTAADLSPDGTRLALLTYRDGYLFVRAPGEAWRDALARPPRALGLPLLPQGEAIAFTREGTALLVSSERLPAPLVRVDLVNE